MEVALLGLAIAALPVSGCNRKAESKPVVNKGPLPTPFILPGARQPAVHPAADVQLPDDAPVIGVLVGDRPRAYLVSAMSKMTHHVINDLLADAPVTVTYCDRTDCVRVYTSDTPGSPLAVDLGGWKEKMMLRVGNCFYWQDSAQPINPEVQQAFPYRPLAHERTTWAAWRKKHPSTEVFTGQ
jgi:hypothetical protein